MKSQRYRFKLISIFLMALIIFAGVFGFRSVLQYGNRWFSYTANPRLINQKKNVTEGSISDRNGTLLASTQDGNRIYAEEESVRKSLVHLIGDRDGMIANTVESFHAAYLYGYNSSLLDAFYRLTHPAEARLGNNLILTVDSALCAEIPSYFDQLPSARNQSGAAVVINYLTGEIIAMVSLPNFDPDNATDTLIQSLDDPYWNRVTQALYPPGSTFKIVTTASALNGLDDITSRTFSCSGALEISDRLTVKDYAGAVHGSLTLSQAFARSCNIVYASLALELGDHQLRKTAEKFGFNRNFLFQDLVVYNSVYPLTDRSQEAIAASGYGQSALTVTPLHLCLISAAIAADGKMPEPKLLREVRTSAGSPILSLSASTVLTACDTDTASRISSMMKETVQGSGTGSKAFVTTLDVRGKTGTAESTKDGSPINYAWFTGFNAQKDLPFAVCVLVENVADGETGGSTAAVIAGSIFNYLKLHPDRVTN